METQLPARRSPARQLQALLAALRTGNVSTMASAITLRLVFMADTAVLTRTGTHLAARLTFARTT